MTKYSQLISFSFVLAAVLATSGCTAVEPAGLNTKSCGTGEIKTATTCVTAPPISPAPGKSWNLVFAEEFNGDSYDHSKLTPCFDWNYGSCTATFNKGKEIYRPEQVQVKDGHANLVAEPLPVPEPNEACFEGMCSYKSGMISTARPSAHGNADYLYEFTYGYVEAKVMFPAKPGFATAFWLLPANRRYDYRSEIDIAEILGGHPNEIYQSYHYDDREHSFKIKSGGQDNGHCPSQDYSREWTTLGVDWQSDHIAWFINGVECGRFTDAADIENGPMQLILNLTIDTQWERDAGSVLENQHITDQLSVDYVRIFQQR